MRWPSVLRASRFFVVAGATWFSIGLIQLFRGGSGARTDVYLRVGNALVPPSHVFLLAGSILVILGGVYGLFEQRHAQSASLILGQVHFWLTVVPLAILSLALPANTAAGDVNLQNPFQALEKVSFRTLLVIFLAQFVFLSNLAIAFFRKPGPR